MKTLAIDIGGTGVKVLVLDEQGLPLTERVRAKTPAPATPAAVLATIEALAAEQGDYDRVSCGFPGVVRGGVTLDAPNLDPGWAGVDLAAMLTERLGRPTRVLNDADVQGFGAIEGVGVELVITLGTGVGSALFLDGRLLPNLELGHHPWSGGRTYEQQLGRQALKTIGKKRWNKLLSKAIEQWREVIHFQTLYLGGGHGRKVDLDLPDDVKVVSNHAGLLGGIALWRD